ncbi:SRPBCC domain-containing protein [Subtercola sp. PAMC28395]|uniref:SRPBCC domain-containing protein n=1 Tax=Subtercola sp. PAMC28395 TaxID=2846775 RepID=UPI001C0DBD50|nr:SRPBCC domain-containing protein [Subtercola sp. PAMC28395]QWT23384.1 SRPBCC domain-containing protein [Subtercola sp. PAMC28395]
MHFFESKARIAAAPEAVWKHLVNTAAWPDWDSGVEGVDGTVVLGSTLKIRSAAAPGRTFPVKVTTIDEPRTLVFTGGMPLGLFKGVRTYSLAPVAGAAETDFTMREEYTGAMLGMIWKSIPDLNPSFAQFASGLKAVSENVSSAR